MIILDSIDFPPRLSTTGGKITIDLPEYFGGGAKIFIRNVGKEMDLYHTHINCPVNGSTDDGEVIPINTLGRWVFGVPGYMGHIIVRQSEGETIARINYPGNAPEMVEELLLKIKEIVES